MSRIPPLSREDAPDEIRAIYDKYLKERGNVPNLFQVMARAPHLLTTLIDHYRAVMFSGKLPFKLKELLVVKVSQLNSCNY